MHPTAWLRQVHAEPPIPLFSSNGTMKPETMVHIHTRPRPRTTAVPDKEDPLSLLSAAISVSVSTSTNPTSSASLLRAGNADGRGTVNGNVDEAQTQTQAQAHPSHNHIGNGRPQHGYVAEDDGRPPRSSLLLLSSSSSNPERNGNGSGSGDSSSSSSSSTITTYATTTSSSSPSSSTSNASSTSNSTLAFFDKFVNEAKVASESKRRSLLDEILLHQDDPLFHWARDNPRREEGEGICGASEDGEEVGDKNSQCDVGDMDTRGQVEDALRTLLVDTRTAPLSTRKSEPPSPRQNRTRRPSIASTGANTTNTFTPSSSFSSSSTSPSSSVSPGHSPTLTPPTLAPPLLTESVDLGMDSDSERESENTSGSKDSREEWRWTDGFAGRGLRSHRRLYSTGSQTPTQSMPYGSTSSSTLSGIPTRWMSSLLSSSSSGSGSSLPSSSSQSSTGATSSLESIFARTSVSAPSNISTGGTSKKGQAQQIQIPHGDHATIITHHQSPFASHVFTPISGAPGFMEQRYDWDKGFSTELMREMETMDEWGLEWGEKSGSVSVREGGEGEELRSFLGDKKDGSAGVGGGKGNGIAAVGKGKRESVVKRIKGKLDKVGVRERRVNLVGAASSSAAGNGIASGSNEKENEGRLGVGVGEFMEKKTGSVELKGRKEGTAPVLDVALADLLRPHLPALDRLSRTWHLVYSLDQHGISLNTLYNRCEAHSQAQTQAQAKVGSTTLGAGTGIGRPGVFFIAKDSGDATFGVWMGEGIRPSKGKGYYGSGESFMWRYVKDELTVFKWTGRNKYVALCEPDYISFGGGDGRYGLYLDETLFDGTSAGCPTFDNDPLCSPGLNKAGAVAFECVGLEVWGVGT